MLTPVVLMLWSIMYNGFLFGTALTDIFQAEAVLCASYDSAELARNSQNLI